MKHPEGDAGELLNQAAALGVQLPLGQAQTLIRFERLLRERASTLGFVSVSDVDRIRERHVLDCLRATGELGGAKTAYDLGSGAGLPGLVVAMAAPSVRVRLVESQRRRVAFLELAIGELEVSNAEVLHRRVEDLTEPVGACLARAFAPLERAWAVAERLLLPGARLVYFAGAGWRLGQLPPGARVEAVREPVLESSGPLVIMTRQ